MVSFTLISWLVNVNNAIELPIYLTCRNLHMWEGFASGRVYKIGHVSFLKSPIYLVSM
jgi:hypothetical protein